MKLADIVLLLPAVINYKNSFLETVEHLLVIQKFKIFDFLLDGYLKVFLVDKCKEHEVVVANKSYHK